MVKHFKFDLHAKRFRIPDKELLASLKQYAKSAGNRYFSTTEWNKYERKRACSGTYITRFGSWNKTLKGIGIEGGHEKSYSPEVLVKNLEDVWKKLGYPPGKRQINKYGLKISEAPYRKIWGGMKKACEYLSAFHEGKISRSDLLAGNIVKGKRQSLPLKVRYAVFKRDGFRCVECGKSPSSNRNIELEVDHIIPVSRKGTNSMNNLQTLCRECNQGKKDYL